MGGQKPAELEHPPLPAALALLWQTYLDLHHSRRQGSFGPQALGPRDVLDWQEMNGIRLTHWEADTLLHMDHAAQAAQTQGSPT